MDVAEVSWDRAKTILNCTIKNLRAFGSVSTYSPPHSINGYRWKVSVEPNGVKHLIFSLRSEPKNYPLNNWRYRNNVSARIRLLGFRGCNFKGGTEKGGSPLFESMDMMYNTDSVYTSWIRFFPLDIILHPSNGCLEDGSVKFEICISFTDLPEAELSILQPNSITTLIQNFSEMSTDQVFSDFIIKVEDKEFKVHRGVLATRSPVLRKILETDMTEKKEGFLRIEDVDAEVMTEFLHYIYTSEISEEFTNLVELYVVADKYDVPSLTSKCWRNMQRKITVENCLRIFACSSQYDLHDMKKTVMNFIMAEKRNVVDSPEFEQFLRDSPTLGISLLREIL